MGFSCVESSQASHLCLARNRTLIHQSCMLFLNWEEKINESECYKLIFLCLIDSTHFWKAYEPKVPFILRKVVPRRRVTRLPELPRARTNFPTFRVHLLIKLGKPLTWQTKVGSAIEGSTCRLVVSPFFDDRVAHLTGPTFLHKNTLASPAVSTWSRRDNKSVRERCFGQKEPRASIVGLWKGVKFFSHVNVR